MDQVETNGGAAAELARHLKKGSTGRLTVGKTGYEVAVYVMDHHVVAAECSDDVRLLLRRLVAEKLITRRRAGALASQRANDGGLFGQILEEVAEDRLAPALFDRFRENIARYLGSRKRAEFHPMGAVFVENFQMGHDTTALLRECVSIWRHSRKVALSEVLVPVHPQDATAEQRPLLSLLDGTRTVRQALQEAPVEPIYGKAIFARMLRNGIIAKHHEPEPEPEPEPVYEEDPTAQSPAALQPPADDDQTWSHDAAETEVIEQVVREDLTFDDDLPEEVDLLETEVVHVDTYRGPVAVEQPKYAPRSWEDAPTQIPPDDDDDPLPTPPQPALVTSERPTDAEIEDDEDEDDGPTLTGDATDVLARVAEQKRHNEHAAIKGSPGSLVGMTRERWLDTGVPVDDDLMEAFGDYDYSRGSESDGTFSQDQLERVEVADLPAVPDDDDEPIAVGAAPAATFGGKTLHDDQTLAKVAVANQCLKALSAAFDADQGAGSGYASLQILIEGSTSRYSVLFYELQLSNDGELPADQVVRNVNSRPEPERRQLINQGLLDLIERALSLLMDVVEDDDAIDAALEATSGYRQRIGR